MDDDGIENESELELEHIVVFGESEIASMLASALMFKVSVGAIRV